jgi:hypothetical protein
VHVPRAAGNSAFGVLVKPSEFLSRSGSILGSLTVLFERDSVPFGALAELRPSIFLDRVRKQLSATGLEVTRSRTG